MTTFSAEPARGWIPWGALAPFLAIVFVAAPLLAVSGVLERFNLVDAAGDPVGLTGLFAFLLFPFAAIALVVLAWVRFVERRPLATIGLGATGRVRLFLGGHLIGIATIAAVVIAIWLAGGFAATGYATAFASWPALMGIGFAWRQPAVRPGESSCSRPTTHATGCAGMPATPGGLVRMDSGPVSNLPRLPSLGIAWNF